jgi:hypothetical protein
VQRFAFKRKLLSPFYSGALAAIALQKKRLDAGLGSLWDSAAINTSRPPGYRLFPV